MLVYFYYSPSHGVEREDEFLDFPNFEKKTRDYILEVESENLEGHNCIGLLLLLHIPFFTQNQQNIGNCISSKDRMKRESKAYFPNFSLYSPYICLYKAKYMIHFNTFMSWNTIYYVQVGALCSQLPRRFSLSFELVNSLA